MIDNTGATTTAESPVSAGIALLDGQILLDGTYFLDGVTLNGRIGAITLVGRDGTTTVEV